MRILFLTSIAALFLATGTAHAVEWQCGPHYVSTTILHGGGNYKFVGEVAQQTKRSIAGDDRFGVLAYPFYNRTREGVIKNNLPSGGDDEISVPSKGFRWCYAPHPEFRGQRVLTYRGKPCFQYPIEAEEPPRPVTKPVMTEEERWLKGDQEREEAYRRWIKSKEQ